MPASRSPAPESRSPESERGRGSAAAERAEFALPLAALALVLGFYLWRLWALQVAYLDRDEFEHLHAAWNFSRGMMPYRDFYQVHPPWLYFMLAPILRRYPVESDPNAALAAIYAARRFAMLCAGMSLAMTFVLARIWRGSRVAWISIALVSTAVPFARKTLEIRPDGPALVLWLGFLAILVKAIEDRSFAGWKQRGLFALSGLLLGGAIMTTQKLLLGAQGAAVAMLWYLLVGEGPARARLLNTLAQLAGFCVPIVLTAAFLWSHDALRTFVGFVFIQVFQWKHHQPVYSALRLAWSQNPILLTLGILAMAVETPRTFRTRTFNPDKLMLLTTCGAIVGLFEVPVPFLQYFLTFLPLIAIYAGSLLLRMVEAPGPAIPRAGAVPTGVKRLAALGVLMAVALALARPYLVEWWPLITSAVLLSGALALMFRFPYPALALVLATVSVEPYRRMSEGLNPRLMKSQLLGVRAVLENTLATDTVMDGWSGFGLFRRQAWFYSCLNPGMLALLTPPDRDQLLADLQSGEIAPKVIALDKSLGSVSIPVTDFFLRNYVPLPVPYPRGPQAPRIYVREAASAPVPPNPPQTP
jgi:hypothetical protein